MPNNKIYLSNLNKSVTDAQLKEHFAEYGEITAVQLPTDRKSNEPKGYAFIAFAEEVSAKKALAQDGKPFLGKAITVQIATEKRQNK